MRWRERTAEEKANWCYKWFRLLIIVFIIQAITGSIEAIPKILGLMK